MAERSNEVTAQPEDPMAEMIGRKLEALQKVIDMTEAAQADQEKALDEKKGAQVTQQKVGEAMRSYINLAHEQNFGISYKAVAAQALNDMAAVIGYLHEGSISPSLVGELLKYKDPLRKVCQIARRYDVAKRNPALAAAPLEAPEFQLSEDVNGALGILEHLTDQLKAK